MRNEILDLLRSTRRESAAPSSTFRANEPQSMFRAFQTAPLSRLASNGTEQAHVRTSAILGYN
ncbi:hypothetical protein R8871_05183 [Paraburkholderia graminis C4D1M]|jgi:hypothetical protein|uniref:Uncharacterized protein n=1 Tax=Paraburkholderia graminis (strain ATCC 700544 / DSM 17151 / LMG 18924 / NCIMB 13744 / C4D1M) TaxID=396598 RepID=B1G6G8_PARG4|nr:hypothetical protein [Paraburkholderia graminis]EDT08334.1 hypothetical protein BgramDRAFT_5016 [Paraburkholderia graminis C4D1M]CAB3724644.1 hypothetical protein R8871_05183 [Paraburkholderia graminis C4D1M]